MRDLKGFDSICTRLDSCLTKAAGNRHRPAQKVMRETELDGAGLFKARTVFIAQRHVQCAQVVLQLFQGSRPQHRCRDSRIEQSPSQCDLC
jgi:hypothetical protein